MAETLQTYSYGVSFKSVNIWFSSVIHVTLVLSGGRFLCGSVMYMYHEIREWFGAELVTSHYLTHWGRATHICVSKLTIIASDNGLSPGRRQAIIWNNAGILSIGPLGTNFSEILIEILTFSFTKMRLKVSSAKWRPFCLGLNMLNQWWSSSLIQRTDSRFAPSQWETPLESNAISHWLRANLESTLKVYPAMSQWIR